MNYLVFSNVNHFFTAAATTFGEDETCNAEEVECQFPFKYTTLGEDKIANKCTNDVIFEDEDYDADKTEEDFYWCATRVDADGRMKEGKWARCDEASEACMP